MSIFLNNKTGVIKLKLMKKTVFFVALLMIIPLITGMGFNESGSSAPGVSASANKKSFSPGESGVLNISFKTGSKVKIPKEPGVTMELTSGGIEGNGFQDYSGGDGEYISNSKVKYNFRVPDNAVSGSTITITGKVKFGYCTVTDGVCKMANQNFTAKIKVK